MAYAVFNEASIIGSTHFSTTVSNRPYLDKISSQPWLSIYIYHINLTIPFILLKTKIDALDEMALYSTVSVQYIL